MRVLRISAGISAICLAVLSMPAYAQLASLFREDVPEISLSELHAALEEGGAQGGEIAEGARPVLLVDVRSPEESGVSMIPGAITQAAYEKEASKYEGYRVVSYCTVGVRSERYTRKLRKAGVDAVFNIYAEAGAGLAQHGMKLFSQRTEDSQC